MNRKTKKQLKTIFALIVFFISLIVFYFSEPLENIEYKNNTVRYKEADYVKEYCNGEIEHILSDKTRIDCLTDEYAIEFDWGKKWAESIGQSLYYANMTGKKPAVALIIKSPNENKYADRIKIADNNIKIFIIKAKDYKD